MPKAAPIIISTLMVTSALVAAVPAVGDSSNISGLSRRTDSDEYGGCDGTGHTCTMPVNCKSDADCTGDRNGRGIIAVISAHCGMDNLAEGSEYGTCTEPGCADGWDVTDNGCHCSDDRDIGQQINGQNKCNKRGCVIS